MGRYLGRVVSVADPGELLVTAAVRGRMILRWWRTTLIQHGAIYQIRGRRIHTRDQYELAAGLVTCTLWHEACRWQLDRLGNGRCDNLRTLGKVAACILQYATLLMALAVVRLNVEDL